MIGERLRIARDKAQYTQTTLANMLEVSQGAVAHWEAGRRDIPFDLLFKAAEILNITPAELVDPDNYEIKEQSRDNKHTDLISKAICVLDSRSPYTEALIQNIEAFYAAVTDKNNFESRLTALENSIIKNAGPPGSGQHGGGAITRGQAAKPPKTKKSDL